MLGTSSLFRRATGCIAILVRRSRRSNHYSFLSLMTVTGNDCENDANGILVVLVPGLLGEYGNLRLRMGERYDLCQTEVVAVGETRT